MYENFINSFKNIMAESGYVKINIPSLPSPAPVDMWARESGAMAYFYITYNCESMQSNFASYENFMRQSIAEIADRVHARHTVAFSIFVGRLDAHAESLINTTAEFALVPRYDVYFGVDENSGIRHHPSAPTKMDKSLVKIQTALNPIAAARLSGTNMAKTVVKFPLFTYSIIAINVFMFILLTLTGGSQNTMNLLRFGAAQYHLTFQQFELYRLITPIFLHIGVMHLIMNCFWLIIAGAKAERHFGHFKFLLIYLISGVVGNVAMMLLSPYSVGAGASGGIFGIFGALLVFMLITKKQIEGFSVQLLASLIVISTLMGFAAPNMLGGNTTVGNAAHIGGLITGAILGLILTNKKHAGASQ